MIRSPDGTSADSLGHFQTPLASGKFNEQRLLH